MLLRYRYRIEPTTNQKRELARVFGCCRVVYNDALMLRRQAHRDGVKISDTEVQHRVTVAAKLTAERGWLAEVSSVALVQSVNDSRRAFKNFFESRADKRSGFKRGQPRLKSKKDRRQSCRLTRNAFSLRRNGRLCAAKVGELRVRWSRPLPSKPSSVTIIREPDGHYYASFVVDFTPAPLPTETREAGVDVGINRLATVATTDGQRIDVPNPRHLESRLRKLRRLERRKSRQERGSKNRDKSVRKIAIAHGAVARARRDYHHKQALALVRDNQVIYVEDLNVVGMFGNRRLARAISDVGWAQFMRVITEKAQKHGRSVHRVSRWLASTKTCSTSGCGFVLDYLPLHSREWTCPACLTVHDRDFNAAIVILAAGRAERRNASHASGRDHVNGSGGAPVSPPFREARRDEAGSTPGGVATRKSS